MSLLKEISTKPFRKRKGNVSDIAIRYYELEKLKNTEDVIKFIYQSKDIKDIKIKRIYLTIYGYDPIDDSREIELPINKSYKKVMKEISGYKSDFITLMGIYKGKAITIGADFDDFNVSITFFEEDFAFVKMLEEELNL